MTFLQDNISQVDITWRQVDITWRIERSLEVSAWKSSVFFDVK